MALDHRLYGLLHLLVHQLDYACGSTMDTPHSEKADEKSAPLQSTLTDHGHAQIVSEAQAFGDLHRSFTPRQVHVRLSMLSPLKTVR